MRLTLGLGTSAANLDMKSKGSARFPDRPVIYVPGNHEFYHHDIALIDELKAEAPR